VKLKDLFEMPMAKLSLYGDKKNPGSFTAGELSMIKLFTVKKRFHEKLTKIPFDLYVYIVNNEALARIGQKYPEGSLSLGKKGLSYNGSLEDTKDHNELEKILNAKGTLFAEIKKNKEANKKAVHFVMGDNETSGDTIPPTPWILIHRLMHAAARPGMGFAFDVEDVFKTYYTTADQRKRRMIFGDVLGIRSLRIGKKIPLEELAAELFTKYLISGALELHDTTGDEELDEELDRFCRRIEEYVKHTVLPSMRGKIYYI
jgi:hypothetical protein